MVNASLTVSLKENQRSYR